MRLSRPVFLTLLLTAAFAIRLGTVLALGDVRAVPQGAARADEADLSGIAVRLAEGKGFRNAAGLPTAASPPSWRPSTP